MTVGILNTTNETATSSRQKSAERVVNIGLAFNALLALCKTIAGVIGHSQALLADGINSTSDVVYFIVVKIFVKLSGKPADIEHPYGHYQFESIAAVVVGAFVMTTGIAIFWDSANAAFDLLTGKTNLQPIGFFTLWIGIGTIITKIFLMIQARVIGNQTKNIAIAALSTDHRNDIFSSAAAVIGILFGLNGIPWVDPFAGAVVAIVVIRTGFSIIQDSSSDLMDTVPSQVLKEQINRLLKEIHGIDIVEEVHAHRFGPYLVVNITIGINGSLTVFEGNTIAHQAEEHLLNNIEMMRKVYVHYHPWNNEIPSPHLEESGKTR